MHRIDGPSATVDNLFTEGSPAGGVAATVLSAVWLNDLQENLVAVLEAAGVALTKGREFDLLDSINQLIAATPTGAIAAADGLYPLPGGYLLQWGSVTGPASPANNRWDGNLTFPVSMPTFVFANATPAIESVDLDLVAGIGGGATMRGDETTMHTSRPTQSGFEYSVFYKISPSDVRRIHWWSIGKP